MLIGATTDPTFGKVVVFGLGGVLVEVLRGVTFRLAPVDPATARSMLEAIAAAEVLHGPAVLSRWTPGQRRGGQVLQRSDTAAKTRLRSAARTISAASPSAANVGSVSPVMGGPLRRNEPKARQRSNPLDRRRPVRIADGNGRGERATHAD